ncbi:hypothetical protein, partial [Fischerella thermalis]|uniref:hypothetical protein n=1 Tax=Fischerella thermalis TaxID=372787 RepID=UPI0005907F37
FNDSIEFISLILLSRQVHFTQSFVLIFFDLSSFIYTKLDELTLVNQIINLTSERHFILNCLPSSCQKYYLLS